MLSKPCDNEAQIVAARLALGAAGNDGLSRCLFVDEAGQMSLANVLAASSATGSIVPVRRSATA